MLKKYYNLKELYINTDNNIFIYTENDFFFLTGSIGILKIKFNFYFFIYKIFNLLIIKHPYDMLLFAKKNYNYNLSNRIIKKAHYIITNAIFGYTIKFKIIGLGHKILYSNNIFFLKLGYTHLIYSFIPLYICSKKKKKKICLIHYFL